MTSIADPIALEPAERDRLQSRTIRVLMGSQVFGGMGLVAGYIPAALLGKEITGSATLAGLAAAMLSVGTTAASFPLASYMRRHGRRPGLRTGYLVAFAGAITTFAAAALSFYPLLLIGIAGIGTGNACNLAARYAAADLATDERRASSISVIVWATTIGSATGSWVALAVATSVAVTIGLPELGGPYVLSAAVFAVAALIVHVRLRPDPLVAAGGLSNDVTATESRLTELRRAFGLIASRPKARLAVGALVVSQAVMVAVMTMTPLHMDDGGQSPATIGFMMTIHILGMYAFSPIVGLLSDLFGRLPMILLGGVLLLAGAEFAARTSAGDAFGVIIGNFLIGLGWGFGVIAGSSLLTESVELEDRVSVQGAADLVMSGFGAGGGLSSGAVVALRSYADLGRASVIAAGLLLVGTVIHWVRATGQPGQAADLQL